MATDWAAEAAKFGGQAVQSAPGKTDWGAEAAKFGGKATQVQAAPAGHAPDWTDDVKASASFLGNELAGVGHALNPVNIVGGIANTIAHPVDTVTALVKMPKTMYDQYQSGDMEGLAKNIGNIAGGVILGKVAPEAPGAASDAAATASKYGARVAENAPALGKATANMVKSTSKDLGAATAVNLIPGVGHTLSAALALKAAYKAYSNGTLGEVADAAGNLFKPTTAENIAEINARQARTQAAYASPAPTTATQVAPEVVPAPVAPRTTGGRQLTPDEVAFQNAPRTAAPQTPSAPPQVSTKVQIPTRFSVDSASDTMGTRAPSAAPTVATSGLDADATRILSEAANNGVARALSVSDRSALTTAVKAGDSAKVKSLLGDRPHAAVSRTDTSVINKVAAMTKYAVDHNMDVTELLPKAQLVNKFIVDNELSPDIHPTTLRKAAASDPDVLAAVDKLQEFADNAYKHGVTKHGLAGNKRGFYKGISPDTVGMVQHAIQLATGQ